MNKDCPLTVNFFFFFFYKKDFIENQQKRRLTKTIYRAIYKIYIYIIHHQLQNNDNDNDNELFIQTKLNEKHHKCNINNIYNNTNIKTFVPRRLHLKKSWPLAYNHL